MEGIDNEIVEEVEADSSRARHGKARFSLYEMIFNLRCLLTLDVSLRREILATFFYFQPID